MIWVPFYILPNGTGLNARKSVHGVIAVPAWIHGKNSTRMIPYLDDGIEIMGGDGVSEESLRPYEQLLDQEVESYLCRLGMIQTDHKPA